MAAHAFSADAVGGTLVGARGKIQTLLTPLDSWPSPDLVGALSVSSPNELSCHTIPYIMQCILCCKSPLAQVINPVIMQYVYTFHTCFPFSSAPWG